MQGNSRATTDPQASLRARLEVFRVHHGNPALRVMADLSGVLARSPGGGARTYSFPSIKRRLDGETPMDWLFLQTMVLVCHRHAGRKGEPDLTPWRLAFEQTLRHDHWIGSPPPLAAAYQIRPEAAELSSSLVSGHVLVLTGLGGAGKTQLAAELAYRFPADHVTDIVVWIEATSRSAILSTLVELADELGVKGGPDEEALARRALRELANRDGGRSLVVLDDVRDPADLHGLWPPRGNTSTVVTTRCRQDSMAGGGRTIRAVGVFAPQLALSYLAEKLDGEGLEAAGDLAEALGNLPLALSLAGAYMKNYNLDCAGYLRRFRDRRLAELKPDPNDRTTTTLATAWDLSIAAADERPPAGAARLLLRLAAVLDPHAVPAAIGTTEVVRKMLTEALGTEMTTDDASDALANLILFSLGDLRDRRRTVEVHPLVQRSVREEARGAVPGAVRCAADALLEIWPDVESDTGLVEQLRNNVDALRRHAADALWDGELHQVVFRAGNSLWPQGLTATSLGYWRELLPEAVRRLGAEHPDTLSIRNNLAWALHRTDDHAGALAGMREVLELRRRVLGLDEPNTMASRHAVAVFQAATGDLRGAADSLTALVAAYESRLGPGERDTLNARMDLACTLGDLGSPDQAVAGVRAVLAGYRRHPDLGPEHPETLAVELVLAGWLASAERLDEARAVVDELAATSEQVLGPHHIQTLRARYYAADMLGQRGHRAEAETAMGVLLDDLRPLLAERRPEADEIRDLIGRWFDGADG